MKGVGFVVLLSVCALCGVSGAANDEPAPREDPDDVGVDELAFIRRQLACTGAERAYCEAIDRFGQGTPLRMPSSPHARLGRTLFFSPRSETAAYMVGSPDGLMTGEVTPDSPEEAAQIAAVVETLRAGGTVPPSDPVASYVSSLARTSRLEWAHVAGRSRMFGDRERRHFRETVGGEVVVLTVTDAGPQRVAIFR